MNDTAIEVTQYKPHDISIKAKDEVPDPFFAEIYGVFTGPGGQHLKIPAFYNGNGTWIIRFSADEAGDWRCDVLSGQFDTDITGGEISCHKNNDPMIHGGLRIDPEHPCHFKYEDGTDHFMMAYECDWLFALGLGDSTIHKVKDLCRIIKKYGFNGILFNAYAYDTPWAEGRSCKNDYGPPLESLWAGDIETPDHSRMNTAFFENLDKTMDHLLDQGITAHVFLKVYNKGVSWPEKYSREDDLYFKYIVSRYQAYPNIIWDHGKESFHESDKEYIANRIRLVRDSDAYDRLITIHDDRYFYHDPEYSSLVDFYTAQQHIDLNTASVLERERKAWPIFNSEFGYELVPGYKPLINSRHTAEEMIHRAYKVVMSGAYTAYYNHYTAWDIIDYEKIPKGYDYFVILYDFFTSIRWKELEPHNELCLWNDKYCLADPGKEYVFYFGKLVIVNIDLEEAEYKAEWLNIFTGEKTAKFKPEQIMDNGPQRQYKFVSPFGDMPVLLHLSISSGDGTHKG